MRSITRTTVALIVVGGALLACMNNSDRLLAPRSADAAVGHASGSQQSADLLGLNLFGSPPPSYFVCRGNGGPYSGSAVIGLLGGVVHFGPHELDLPPLAVLRPTLISARTIPGDTIAVAFQPQGQTFLVPASLQLSYAQCRPQPTKPLSILYVNNLLNNLLAIIESLDNPALHRVTGVINHFSVYAVAERR
jgi:hypothetical protein